MKHQRIQNQLSAYLDNELATAERQHVDDHLHDCQECTDMLSDFMQNRQQIAALVHPAPSMKNAVLAMIREAEAAPKSKLLPALKRWIFRPFTVGATAFSTICLIGFFYFTYTPGPKYDELHDYYFGLQAEELSNNPLKSNAVTPLSNLTTETEEIREDTESLLNFYFGD